MSGIERRRRDTELLQGFHLVLHQGDQRRNNDCRPLHTEGRDLVAERLAATRRHEDKGVPFGNDMIDNVGLISPECGIAENGGKNLGRVTQHTPLYSHPVADQWVIGGRRRVIRLRRLVRSAALLQLFLERLYFEGGFGEE